MCVIYVISEGVSLDSSKKSYKLNHSRIACELMDGEYVIIDFDTGSYFNTDRISSWILYSLVNSKSLDEIIANLKEQYGSVQGDMVSYVMDFIEDLLDNSIIEVVNDTEPASSYGNPKDVSLPNEFTQPLLNKYTDLQELLLLDPIHEVAPDTGWPKFKD